MSHRTTTDRLGRHAVRPPRIPTPARWLWIVALVLPQPVFGAGPATKTPPRAAPEPAADEVEPTPEPEPEVPTEAPDEPPPTSPAEAPPEPDAEVAPHEPAPAIDASRVAELRHQADDLRDRLFKARARVSIVGSKLFQSKLTLSFKSNLERFYRVSDLTVTVDGAPVFHRDEGLPPTADELFELFAAPGTHEVGVSADLVARRDQTYKIRLDQSFTITVPEQSTVSSRLTIRETGNMWRFAKRRRGHHALHARLRAKTKKLPGARRGSGGAEASATGSIGGKGGSRR